MNIHQKIHVRAHVLQYSASVMARQLGVPKLWVEKYRKQIKANITKEMVRKFRAAANSGKTLFTPKMDMVLRQNYLAVPKKTLARQLGVSPTCLDNRLKNLGLSVPEEILMARRRANQFYNGQEPHNKGVPLKEWMPKEKIHKTKIGQFKSGRLPHNTVHEKNAERKRKDLQTGRWYVYQKIGHGNWQLKHRLVWERANGPIPKGHIITFKDGNTQNCHLHNLECITMAQNAARNIEHYHSLPPVLKTSVKLNKKLIQQIRTS